MPLLIFQTMESRISTDPGSSRRQGLQKKKDSTTGSHLTQGAGRRYSRISSPPTSSCPSSNGSSIQDSQDAASLRHPGTGLSPNAITGPPEPPSRPPTRSQGRAGFGPRPSPDVHETPGGTDPQEFRRGRPSPCLPERIGRLEGGGCPRCPSRGLGWPGSAPAAPAVPSPGAMEPGKEGRVKRSQPPQAAPGSEGTEQQEPQQQPPQEATRHGNCN